MIGLQMKVVETSPELLSQLKAASISFRQPRGKLCIYVQLQQIDDGKYQVPDFLTEFMNNISINISECGGLKGKTGEGTVVCGIHGYKLNPYYVNMGDPNGNHAYFSLRMATMVICTYPNLLFEIVNLRIKTEGNTVRIEIGKVFHGDMEELKKTRWEFVDAAEAAMEIASTRNCCDAHFIAE